jgi:hypothetical protein
MEETRRAEPILMLAERLTCLPRAIGPAFLFVTRRRSQTDARRSAFEPMDYPMHRRLTVMASPTGGGLYSRNIRVGYSHLEQYQRIGVI